MIHQIPEFVSIPSRTLTLQPGSVISTGTPVSARIEPGDIAEMEITKIGKLRNPVIKEN
jgi:2-keto-4-pentenoate hydratase/2-oxohepta-3-ene-1,7-dioic acid hydratase in catechol pathway